MSLALTEQLLIKADINVKYAVLATSGKTQILNTLWFLFLLCDNVCFVFFSCYFQQRPHFG